MALVLCGAGRDRQRGGKHVAVHHSAKTSWRHRKRTVGTSPSGGGAGTAEVIDRAVANYLTYFGGKMVPKCGLIFPCITFWNQVGFVASTSHQRGKKYYLNRY